MRKWHFRGRNFRHSQNLYPGILAFTMDALSYTQTATNTPRIHENLPSMWSSKDNYASLALTHSNLWVTFRGHGKSQGKDAASVRSNNPIPKSCGIYYYEISIISKGRDGYIGIGLSSRKCASNRLPGWDKNSYGYHGDDGFIFTATSTGKPYGPIFTTGDVIGCGLNTITNTCFYTKNGIYLGIAFHSVPPNYYPTVGLQTSGETIAANFGQEDFVFDIEGFTSSFRQKILDSIVERQLPSKQVSNSPYFMHQLVLSYLVHNGHCKSAKEFASATRQEIPESEESMVKRQQIHNYILTGKLSEAMKMCNQLYPALFESNIVLKFRIKCQHFLEVLSGNDSFEEVEMNGTGDISCFDSASNFPTLPTYKELASLVLYGRNELIPLVTMLIDSKLMTEELTSYYHDIFSILVYPDPVASPLNYLLDKSQRVSLGNCLNSAILTYLNSPSKPPLYKLLQYSNQVWHYMDEKEVSSTALVSLEHFCK